MIESTTEEKTLLPEQRARVKIDALLEQKAIVSKVAELFAVLDAMER